MYGTTITPTFKIALDKKFKVDDYPITEQAANNSWHLVYLVPQRCNSVCQAFKEKLAKLEYKLHNLEPHIDVLTTPSSLVKIYDNERI